MKKIGMLAVIIMLMAFVTAAQAEVKAGSFSFTPFTGYYVFEGNQDLKNSPIFGLRAGYNFTKNLGLEGYFSYLQTEIQDESQWKPWQDVYSYGIEGLYHFMPDGRIVPFIAIGLGGIHYSEGFNYTYNSYYGAEPYGDRFESNKYSVDYGAGVKFFLTDNIALRADVRHVLPINGKWNNPDNVHNDFLATFGINFAFGGEKKEVVEARVEEPAAPIVFPVAPVEVIVDSDKDGVPDNLDKCPDTPAGVTVDKDGCPLDSDNDGVPDYLDKCPNTPVGAVVDKAGCPLDSDNDGVPDYLDKCPNTPAGAVVDENGCVHEKVSMTLDVEFDTAKAVIKKKYHNEIKKVADFIKSYPGTNVVIEGHSDNVDIHKEPERNIRLSLARAESVRKYLIEKFGIDASRITAVGYGPDKPIASNDTEKGRKKNRRVEAVIDAIKIK
jgi:OOP family OmpA-OmpF porin